MRPANGENGTSLRTLVAVHRAGGSLRCVAGPSGGGRGVSAWTELPAGKPERLAAWLAEQGAGAVLGVLPAGRVVVRTCLLPSADAFHLDQALALQAEAHVPSDMPPWRQARAVLPMAPGETSRSGVLAWWPPGPAERELPGADPAAWPGPVAHVPDVAALAALLNGRRPDGALLWFDRDDGSVALAISHANGLVFRAARVGGARLAADVARVVAETALSVGHGPEFAQALAAAAQGGVESVDRSAGLVAPPEVVAGAAARLPGSPDDPRWWRDYAVAAGALLAATGELAALARFQAEAPIERPSRIRRIVDALSTPRGAAKACLVSVAVALFSPLAFAGLRLAVLELKLPDLSQAMRDARDSETGLAVYGDLRTQGWPMTKLISDIACNTPEAIEIEQIRIRHGEPVSVSGRARPDEKAKLSAQEVVTLMQDNLRRTDMFQEIHLNWGDPNSFGHYEFNLTARVVNPYRAHAYPRELDYGAWTLAERLYPSPAAPAAPQPDPPAAVPAGGDDDADADADAGSGEPVDIDLAGPVEAAPPRTRVGSTVEPGGSFVADGDVVSRGSERPAGGLPPSKDIPESLTPEQIAAMGLAEAQEHYGHFSQAIQQARLDPAERQRLWQDWKLLRERVRVLKAEQEKGGAP
jgi:hypothetical protein